MKREEEVLGCGHPLMSEEELETSRSVAQPTCTP